MLGNHDTPPILDVAERWLQDGSGAARARYLADRLDPDPASRARTATAFGASPLALAQAHLADLFVSDARHVCIYFTDLYGAREPFNRAGIVHPDNWSQRLPADYAERYEARRAQGCALDLRAALVLALRARGAPGELISALARDVQR
jgi:hypothetical protein